MRRQAASKWRAYRLQKNVELLELVSEDDTDSNALETALVADLDMDVSAYLVDMPLVPLLDSPASTSTEYWAGKLDLDLGFDFGLDATFP
jgi:DNA-directed RNA polymerase subunit L